jgi:hypothetical protein
MTEERHEEHVILAVVIRETRQLERRAAGATVEAGAEKPA